MYNKRFENILELNDCEIVKEDKNQYYISFYSNAGEDFGFTIYGKNTNELIDSMEEYADDFDPEEHASMWYGANRGEPTSLKDLLDDSNDIKDTIKDIVRQLRGIEANNLTPYLERVYNDLYEQYESYEDVKIALEKMLKQCNSDIEYCDNEAL